MRESLKEELASYAHKLWSNWIRYLFSKSYRMKNVGSELDGGVIIRPEFAQEWLRLMNVPYDELSEVEKKSVREEALKIIDIFVEWVNQFSIREMLNERNESRSVNDGSEGNEVERSGCCNADGHASEISDGTERHCSSSKGVGTCGHSGRTCCKKSSNIDQG